MLKLFFSSFSREWQYKLSSTITNHHHSMGVIEVESEAQFLELTKSDPTKLIALYFHAPWAVPCRTMNSVFKTLADSKLNDTNTIFLSINADDLSEISEVFDVSAVPYFILIRNKVILKELSGADPKEFITALNQFLLPESAKPVEKVEKVVEEPVESEDELNSRLIKLTSAAPVMVFIKGSPSAPQCGFSRQLVAILREHQVRFGFFDILKDDNVRQGLKKFSDWPTFPQVYMNGEFQGGLDIVKESLEEDDGFFSSVSV